MNNPPILTMKCAKCGATYFAHVMCHPIDAELANDIADWVKEGDTPEIVYGDVRLSMCRCDEAENEEEG